MLKRDFSEDQQMFGTAYRKILQQEIVPHMDSWREQGIVDRKAFSKARAQGFLMVWPAEEFGGSGDNDFRFEQIIILNRRATRWYPTGITRCIAG